MLILPESVMQILVIFLAPMSEVFAYSFLFFFKAQYTLCSITSLYENLIIFLTWKLISV